MKATNSKRTVVGSKGLGSNDDMRAVEFTF